MMLLCKGKGRRRELGLAALLLAAYGLRLHELNFQSLWLDEADVIDFVAAPMTTLLDRLSLPGWNGPLYHLLVRYWFDLVGVSSFTLRFFSVLTGTLSVAAIWALSGHWVRPGTRWALAILAASSPYLVWYSQEGKMYSLLLFIVSAAVLFVYRSSRRRQWLYGLGALLLTWAGWYIHLLAALLLPVLALLWLSLNERRLHHILLLLLLAGLYLPLLKWQFPAWLSDFETGHMLQKLGDVLRIQLFVFAAGFPSKIAAPAVIVNLLFLVIGGAEALVSDAQKRMLLVYFLLPILLLYAVSLGMPIYTDRYLITVAPAYYALVALGFQRLSQSNPRVAYSLFLVLLAINLAINSFQTNTLIKPPAL